jgi:hypothetical protein
LALPPVFSSLMISSLLLSLKMFNNIPILPLFHNRCYFPLVKTVSH